MIVKIRSVDDGWLFLEANTVKVRPLTKEQYEFGVGDLDSQYRQINVKNLYCSDGKIFVKVININNGKILVYTNRESFLLNDEGKTIDRI